MAMHCVHENAVVSLRVAAADDFLFAFDVKRDAMRPHVEKRWDWDEPFQLAHHTKRWSERRWFIIERDATPIGTVALDWKPTHLQFGEFYLLNAYRRQGIGNCVLTGVLKQADRQQMETRLEVLRWNPACALYARHGFKEVSANETHYFFTRSPIPL